MSRVGGIISFQVEGERFFAKGEFSYRINPTKKEMVVGHDQVHGHKEVPQVSFIEGKITDQANLDLQAFQALVDKTITLDLANGKTVVLEDAVYASEGAVTTEEGEIEVRFEGFRAREIT